MTVALPDVFEIAPITDAMITEFLEEVGEEDFTVGVYFQPRGKLYTYLAPPTAHVGSIVVVPPNSFRRTPRMVRVAVLNPPIPPGLLLVRVLEVVS